MHPTKPVLSQQVNQLISVIDHYDDQLRNQLAHSDELQAFIRRLQPARDKEKIIKLESENYALYEHIHSIKYPTLRGRRAKAFNIGNLKRELSLDTVHTKDSTKNTQTAQFEPPFMQAMQKENMLLQQNLKSFVISLLLCLFFWRLFISSIHKNNSHNCHK